MNLHDYISSGVLELYANQMLSPEETQEVERMRMQHPEVEAELQAIEEALAMQAMVNFKEPKSDLLVGIMARIEEEEEKMLPASDTQAEARVIPMTEPKPRSSGIYKWLSIAAAVLLLFSLIGNYYLFDKLDETEMLLATLENQNTVLAEQYEGLRTNYDLLKDPTFNTIRMAGQAASPNSFAAVIWNQENGNLYLDPGNLPETAADKQYQLWAIIDGVPVSAGVFDAEDDLLQMPEVSGEVAAFAVTLEPRGGSESPTLEQMYVLGEA